MALRVCDQPLFAARLAYLMRSARVTAQALSLGIGRKKGYVSWLMTGAGSVPMEVLNPIAEWLAAHAGWRAVDVAQYLAGITDEPPIEGGLESAPPRSHIPGYLHAVAS